MFFHNLVMPPVLLGEHEVGKRYMWYKYKRNGLCVKNLDCPSEIRKSKGRIQRQPKFTANLVESSSKKKYK